MGDSKREMDKLRDEINQIKKMINSKTKETNKLRTQLEKISKERDQAQAKIVDSEATLESTNTQLADDSEQTERTLNRVSQLEKALKEIKSKKSEKEKEKIVNKLFDKKSVEIEVDETKKILDQRVAEKGELLKEIQLQNERMVEIESSRKDKRDQIFE